MALYLKYRPQTLDQLIGQEQIKNSLLSAYQADKLSHAYLFVGPRGTGKTSTARILAKMVNCESLESRDKSQGKGNNSEPRLLTLATGDLPCNKCPSCLSITDGSNLDLIEIDAASNRGIDDIRTLRENIKLSPSSSKKKIYIIDEVHMLTTEAFNALLKTLEEPPKHALFILATTDVQKVPQTILSRVQRLEFKLATPEDLLKALKVVIDAEKIQIEEEALKVIVKRAEGSFRDGVKLLDQMSSTGNKITLADVSLSLQTVEFDLTVKFIELLKKKNVTECLTFISNNIVKGTDAKGWVMSLTEAFRNLMLIKSGVGKELVATEYSEPQYLQLSALAAQFEVGSLVKTLDLLQQALEKMRFTSIATLPLELVVVEVCLETSHQSSVISHQTSENTVVKEHSENILSSRAQRSGVEGSSSRNNISVADSSSTLSPQNDNKAVEARPASDDAVSVDVALLQEKWNFVLETVKPYNFSLEALLRLVKILEVGGGMVVLEVPYSFHQRILEAPKSRDLLESVLTDVLARPTRVSCVVAQKPMTVDDIANVEVAADDEIIKAAAEIFSSDSSN